MTKQSLKGYSISLEAWPGEHFILCRCSDCVVVSVVKINDREIQVRCSNDFMCYIPFIQPESYGQHLQMFLPF